MTLFAIAAMTFAILFAFERIRPLRRAVEAWPRRVARNLTVGGIAFAVVFPIQLALLVPLSRREFGVLHVIAMPAALRFHFAEHLLSIGWRAAQIVVIGADPLAVWIWQMALFVSILFHHSNVRLPPRLERAIVRFVVTPRMHGIHHAQREEWTNSNWASILTCWDFLHRTLRLDVPDEAITIGIPAYDDAREVTLGRILALPFRRQRSAWQHAS